MPCRVSVDSDLIAEVMQVTGIKTEREAAEEALRTLIRSREHSRLGGTVTGTAEVKAKLPD